MTDKRAFRQCLGKFATGVAVVTCNDSDNHPCGITANSFSSVSLDPQLVLWNLAKASNSLNAYLDARHFAINVLSVEQKEVSVHFAKSGHTLFDDIEYSRSANGVPLMPDTLASFECRTHEVHDCGDHYIIIGEVTSFSANDRDPLLFFSGEYNRIGD